MLRKKKSNSLWTYPVSGSYLRARDLFAEHIKNCHFPEDVAIYNSAIVVQSIAYIESLLNQELETLKFIYEGASPERAEQIYGLKKKGTIPEKWNEIYSLQTGLSQWYAVQSIKMSPSKWDEGKATFSDFTALISLRNEILHDKCEPLEPAGVTVKSIKRIMFELCEEFPFGKKPFNRLMSTSSLNHLLQQKELFEWCIQKTEKLERAMSMTMGGDPFD